MMLEGWIGKKVYLRGLKNCGDPGVVIREIRGKLTVYWTDLEHWSSHHPDSLELAKTQSTDSPEAT
jgi:hypothetical protein